MAARGVFARIAECADGPVVAVRAYFRATLDAAIRQKARWMTGIALAGWDRVGWGGVTDWRDHWMRMRDRRAPIAVLVLAVAYVALLAWGMSLAAHALFGGAAPLVSPPIAAVMAINAGLLCWRLVMRVAFTGAAYGWREACWAVPRALVGNFIALLAARRAVSRYIAMLRGGSAQWEKTHHSFPTDISVAVKH